MPSLNEFIQIYLNAGFPPVVAIQLAVASWLAALLTN